MTPGQDGAAEMDGTIAWTLRQPSALQLTPRCPLPPAQANTTHDTLERGFEADRLADARWGCPAGAGSNLPSLRRGSSYEQAKAKLRRIESDEVAVAFGPPA
jgi:hypothetical protein